LGYKEVPVVRLKDSKLDADAKEAGGEDYYNSEEGSGDDGDISMGDSASSGATPLTIKGKTGETKLVVVQDPIVPAYGGFKNRLHFSSTRGQWYFIYMHLLRQQVYDALHNKTHGITGAKVLKSYRRNTSMKHESNADVAQILEDVLEGKYDRELASFVQLDVLPECTKGEYVDYYASCLKVLADPAVGMKALRSIISFTPL
jgi:hypothetical protein